MPSYERGARTPRESGAELRGALEGRTCLSVAGGFRRLLVRRERYLSTFRAFLSIAFVLVLLRHF